MPLASTSGVWPKTAKPKYASPFGPTVIGVEIATLAAYADGFAWYASSPKNARRTTPDDAESAFCFTSTVPPAAGITTSFLGVSAGPTDGVQVCGGSR